MRPWRLEDVVHDLSKNGIVGMTASNVMGVGVQGGAQQLSLGRTLANLAVAVPVTIMAGAPSLSLLLSMGAAMLPQARGNDTVGRSTASRTWLRRRSWRWSVSGANRPELASACNLLTLPHTAHEAP